jgi:hypothetical protein
LPGIEAVEFMEIGKISVGEMPTKEIEGKLVYVLYFERREKNAGWNHVEMIFFEKK